MDSISEVFRIAVHDSDLFTWTLISFEINHKSVFFSCFIKKEIVTQIGKLQREEKCAFVSKIIEKGNRIVYIKPQIIYIFFFL